MEFLRGFSAFLDYRYWFRLNPTPLGPSLVLEMFIFMAFLVVAGIALAVVARMLRKKDELRSGLLLRGGTLLWSTGITGLLLLFFAYEQSPLLSMRLWLLLLALSFLVRLGFLAAYVVRDLPPQLAAAAEKARIEKYLPHHKK